MVFKKGNTLGGRKKSGVTRLKSFRKDLADMKFSVAIEMRDLYRKTKDEMLKLELLKLMLEYSQTKPTTSLDEEESASVTDISDAALLKLASGDTLIQTETDGDTESSDPDTVCEGEFDSAATLDTTQDDGTVGSGQDE